MSMKGIFVAYNQAYYMEIVDLLEKNGCRGYTMWEDIEGRGSVSGEPHLGTHAWPTLNNAVLAFVEDGKADIILEGIRKKDSETPELGIRAFVWSVDKAY